MTRGMVKLLELEEVTGSIFLWHYSKRIRWTSEREDVGFGRDSRRRQADEKPR
jgi:hypothetical protein